MAVAAPTLRRRVAELSAGRLRRVRAADRAATALITLGGVFIIIAVSFIFVFILGEALPLFQPARGSFRGSLELSEKPLAIGSDEYQLYVYAVVDPGRVVFLRASDGSVAKEVPLAAVAGAPVTAAARTLLGDGLAVGTADGRVSLHQVRFRPRYEEERLVDLDIEVRDRGVLELDGARRPVRDLAYAESDGRRTVAALVGENEILVLRSEEEASERRHRLEVESGERLNHVRLGRGGDTLVAAGERGNLHYWELATEPRLTGIAAVAGTPITALEFSLGGVSVLVGDAEGNLSAWFRVRLREDDPDPVLVRAHTYPRQGSAIRAIGVSPRDKSFVTAGADGSLVLRHLTSERSLLGFPPSGRPDSPEPIRRGGGAPRSGAIEAVLLTPKLDGLLALGADGRLARYEVRNLHPEMSWKALFGRVWYEGYPQPEFVWQSTGGTDDFEAKFSLVPLIFGTIKGTFYALLFSIPLAVGGALYTSQFVHPSLKSKIKPTVEIMAALPSVVVGFIAGLWLASRVERQVVPVLLMFALLPAFGTAGLLLWDRLPRRLLRRLKPGMELALIVPLLVAGAGVALALGPVVEFTFFGGDFRLWLGSALNLVYDQRNSLVVGLAMGFAVIPIIFTIAEDSFSSVPSHLMAASLALGASRWQTAVRVVLPTASAGVFSAVMIGFGRAVGETMIVLMATGNTPVLDFSIFNGMRTLSANIAVEIPEAPYGGTLYRTLFLAALLLFAMTFVVNTVAELVRQRLRERYRVL